MLSKRENNFERFPIRVRSVPVPVPTRCTGTVPVSITVGAQTNVQDGAVLHCTHDGPYTPGGKSLQIGERVTIGHQACLHGCTIGNEVLVGIGATVLDGAIVEDQVMIGAGSLVPPGKTLESGHLYVGVPVKMARQLKDSEKEFLKYSATHYTKLANKHREITG